MERVRPEYLVAHLRDALADGEAELGIEVSVERNVVLISGVVATPERRDRAEARVRALCGDYVVESSIRVSRPARAEGSELLP